MPLLYIFIFSNSKMSCALSSLYLCLNCYYKGSVLQSLWEVKQLWSRVNVFRNCSL